MSFKYVKLTVVSLALLVSGCALGAPGVQPAQQGASLSITMSEGPSLQALKADVASASVTVTVAGTQKGVSADAPESGTWFFDLSQLPEGEAIVKVEAFDAANQPIGRGESETLLQIGRRNHVSINVQLDSHGRTDFKPVTPLDTLFPSEEGPMPSSWASYFPVPSVGLAWFYETDTVRGQEAPVLGPLSHVIMGVEGGQVQMQIEKIEGENHAMLDVNFPVASPPLSLLGVTSDPIFEGFEAVETPAGFYPEAAKLRFPGPDAFTWTTVWLAQGIGPVQEEFVTRDPMTSETVTTRFRLQHFFGNQQ